MRIAPMDPPCGAITIKAVTVRLQDVAPSELVPAHPIGDIDASALARDLRKRTRPAAIFDTVRFGIVAKCGEKEVALHLPLPEEVNLERLEKKLPNLARWWALQESVRRRAFGSRQTFYELSEEVADLLRAVHDPSATT
jgi:hypothetical protein